MRQVPAVALRTPLAEAARLMRDCEAPALPVLCGAAVVGVVSDLDVVGWTSVEAPEAWPGSAQFTVPSSSGNAPGAIIPGMRGAT